MENSFYDLDYIINMGEKRLEIYTSAYQLVLSRLTNIILVYSAIGIYLISIIQDVVDGANIFYQLAAGIFVMMTIISVVYTIRLLIPVKVAYLEISKRYVQELREEYETRFIPKDMKEEERSEARKIVYKYLKASYIDELTQAQKTNQIVFVKKSSFYYRALISTTTTATTLVPGVDMNQVIASPPHFVKENSSKVETKVVHVKGK